MSSLLEFDALAREIDSVQLDTVYGRVTRTLGLAVEAEGPAARIGDMCSLVMDDPHGGPPPEVGAEGVYEVILGLTKGADRFEYVYKFAISNAQRLQAEYEQFVAEQQKAGAAAPSAN